MRAVNSSLWLGFFTPLLPLFGDHSLHLFSIFFLLTQFRSLRLSRLLLFSTIPFVWSVTSFVLSGEDLSWIAPLFGEKDGVVALGRYLALTPPLYLKQFLVASEWLVFGLITTLFIDYGDKRESYFRGLVFGILLSLPLTLYQYFSWKGVIGSRIVFPNQTALWSELGRAVGTFTDPNAFGVFLSLFALILFERTFSPKVEKKEGGSLLLLLAVFFVGLFAGSRTFYLAIGSYLIFFLLLYSGPLLRSKSRSFYLFGVLLALLLLSGVFAYGEYLSPAVLRIQSTVNALLSMDLSQIATRGNFFLIASEVIADNLFFGVGPLSFSRLVPSYAANLGIPFLEWTDNANSFYLGLLAEYGVIGVVVCIYTFSTLKLRAHLSPIILALFVILFVGPHHYFDEVRLLLAYIVGECFVFSDKKKGGRAAVVLLLILAIPGILVSARKGEFGVYNWEKPIESGAPWTRWTTGRFRIWKSCDDKNAQLTIRNGRQTSITYSIDDGAFSGKLNPGDRRELTLPCEKLRVFNGRSITGEVDSPAFLPRVPGNVSDPRFLGLQLLYRTPEEPLFATKRQVLVE